MMNIKQMLSNIYGQHNTKRNAGQIQRKNMNFGRNKQKMKFIEENNKISNTCNWLKPSVQQINRFTLKYLESHHPSIKKRVVKILSNNRQDRSRQHQYQMGKYSFLNEELKIRSKTIHSQKANVSEYSLQQCNEENKFSSIFQISKTCKMSVKTLTKRSQTEEKQPKSRQCNCETKKIKLWPAKLRVQTANTHDRIPLKNNSFTAWQIDISNNGSFLH